MVVSGAGVMAIESSCYFGQDCDAQAGPTGKALLGVGLVVTAGSVAGLFMSATRLRAHKGKRAPVRRNQRIAARLAGTRDAPLAGIERTP